VHRTRRQLDCLDAGARRRSVGSPEKAFAAMRGLAVAVPIQCCFDASGLFESAQTVLAVVDHLRHPFVVDIPNIKLEVNAFGHDVPCIRVECSPSGSRNSGITRCGILASSLFDIENELRGSGSCVGSPVHWRRSGVVCFTGNRHLAVRDPCNRVDDADACVIARQFRPLFDMQLDPRIPAAGIDGVLANKPDVFKMSFERDAVVVGQRECRRRRPLAGRD
jgi:hypothetical protein